MEIENEESTKQKKIDFVLLIDDDTVDNEINAYELQKAGVSNNIKALTHALEAITYFKNCLTEQPNIQYPVPPLVLLDFRMPFFNGFEVLDEFRKIPDPYGRKKKIKFAMLTGIVNPEHSLRAQTEYSDLIIACGQKPLTAAFLHKIMEKHF